MKVNLKRWVYLAHRWMGVCLCLLLLLWFVSGVVMMYVGYPKLTESERLAHLPALETGAPGAFIASPAQALDRAGIDLQQVRAIRLNRARAGVPTYAVERHGQSTIYLDARLGRPAPPVDERLAQASAQAYAGEAVRWQTQALVQEDASTNSAGLDRHRPLWRFDVAEGPLARLYVSSATGEVVRDVSRTELHWNWVGAWAHWLYMFRGNWLDAYQADIINWSSVLAMVLVATGATVGVWRWRFGTPYKSGSRSPYPSRLMRWHHMSGLLFALVCMTWLFSGLMSMRPWGLLREPPPRLDVAAMHGTMDAHALNEKPWLLAHAPSDLREVRWQALLGDSVAFMVDAQGRAQVQNLRTGLPHRPTEAEVLEAAHGLMHAAVAGTETLLRHDVYYYPRADHTMTGGRERPLPVYRVQFGDAQGTWVHIDARTGELLGSLTRTGRTSRWLFAMLHSWDWLPLLNRRPLWDAVLIALSLGGLAMSLTGVVIGWRRVRKRLPH